MVKRLMGAGQGRLGSEPHERPASKADARVNNEELLSLSRVFDAWVWPVETARRSGGACVSQAEMHDIFAALRNQAQAPQAVKAPEIWLLGGRKDPCLDTSSSQ